MIKYRKQNASLLIVTLVYAHTIQPKRSGAQRS